MIIKTKVGTITLGYKDNLLFCDFGKHHVDKEPTNKLATQLQQYFKGKIIKEFDAPLPNGPQFTRRCWEECRSIPYGETITYKELAESAGSPNAMRAAGQAMRNNPLTILTPCHRVISSLGELHGYSGVTNPKSKELRRKQYLLDLEKGIMTS
jgi:methylated-DNA-[protein]-cysteine S-methyltransferase